jgi:two-component system nitrate/nitrite response regulator NarL
MGCTVVIADRHPVVLEGLRNLLDAHGDFDIVACCTDGDSCIDAIRTFDPEVTVLAATMPGLTATEIISTVKREHRKTRLVFFTASDGDREQLMKADIGESSVISKDVMPDDLIRSLRQVARGETLIVPPHEANAISEEQSRITQNILLTLTGREHQIMRLVSLGLSNKEIGRRLNLSSGTIKVHLHHIFRKLEINNRTVLAALAISADDSGLQSE